MDVQNTNDFLKNFEESLVDLAQYVPNKTSFDSITYLLKVSEIVNSYEHFLTVEDTNKQKEIALAIKEMVDRATEK